jgi:ElaB/YqjD/DUF883 family membrane-anchored ribosome-binding protein
MNEQNAGAKAISPIQATIEDIMKSQEGIKSLLSTGEQLMDNVCYRELEEGKDIVKENQPSNLTETLQKISRDNNDLLAKADHLIKRMRSNF